VKISPDYQQTQKFLHQNPNYGVASLQYGALVAKLVTQTGARSVLDYGAGKQRLREAAAEVFDRGAEYVPYDPAFPEYGDPRCCDLVVCIDVLEHVEIDCLDDVMRDLWVNMRDCGFFTIHTGPAMKVLPDGRNAHLIQCGSEWWLPKLSRYFRIHQLHTDDHGFWVVAKKLVSTDGH
jgi:hypothetical protein